MRAALILLAVTATAYAQDPPDPYPKPLAPQPDPVPQPRPEPPALQLSTDDTAILARGEIDPDVHYGGIAANAIIGFGLGQAIQGRWLKDGWKFTAGMTAGMVLFFTGADRDSTAIVLVGGIGVVGFYTWGLVDSIIGPQRHNRRWKELRRQLGLPITAVVPYVSSTTAGVVMRF